MASTDQSTAVEASWDDEHVVEEHLRPAQHTAVAASPEHDDERVFVTILARTKLVRDSGLVSMRIAVPLRRSAETVPATEMTTTMSTIWIMLAAEVLYASTVVAAAFRVAVEASRSRDSARRGPRR